jgi:hypothetical protein
MARFTPTHRRFVLPRRAWPVALALAFVLGNLCNAALLAPLGHAGAGAATSGEALAAPRPDGGGQAVVGQPVTPKHIALHPSATPPTPTAQQRQAQQAARDRLARLKKPAGPVHQLTAAETAALARTAGPPLPTPKPSKTSRPTAPMTPTAPRGPQTDSDFDVENFTVIGSWGICPSDCSVSDQTTDMSVANDGDNYWAVGDYFCAYFNIKNSNTGYCDPVAIASSFGEYSCCSQQVLYEPSRALFLLSFQTGAGHLVLYNLSSMICGYDITPVALGLTASDFLQSPDLEYSANYLYLSFVDSASSSAFVGADVIRIPLSPLQGCGSVVPELVQRSDNASFTLAQGATDTMYWLSNDYLSGPTNGNHVRVFFWPEKSNGYTYLDESITAYNFLAPGSNPDCSSQDGTVTNWCHGVDSTDATLYRSRSGFRGFGAPMLGMAWPAGPTNGLSPFPYVVREYFLLANMSYKGHDNVYSPNYAVAWPSLAAPTTRGYVGGTFTIGGGTGTGGSAQDYDPGNLYLIEDPDTPTQPWSTFLIGGVGNADALCQCWGYTMARAWNPDELHWVAAGSYVASSRLLYVLVFGRGRDHQAYLRWATS